MEIETWLYIGMTIGVISTIWFSPLRISKLILFIIIGSIGSVSGGVIGYMLFGFFNKGVDLSVFLVSLISTSLFIITRRKIKFIYSKYFAKKQEIFLLPERSIMSLGI